mgnify:CR=1 FL=1
MVQGEDKTEILTGIYDEYIEKDVGDYFAQPPHLPQGFKVSFNFFQSYSPSNISFNLSAQS